MTDDDKREARRRAHGHMISATLADLLATAAINEHRLHCQCPAPLPRVWDQFQWSTCRLCNRLLSQDEYEDRQR